MVHSMGKKSEERVTAQCFLRGNFSFLHLPECFKIDHGGIDEMLEIPVEIDIAIFRVGQKITNDQQ